MTVVLNNGLFSASVLFKASISRKGSVRHDLAFKRRAKLAKKLITTRSKTDKAFLSRKLKIGFSLKKKRLKVKLHKFIDRVFVPQKLKKLYFKRSPGFSIISQSRAVSHKILKQRLSAFYKFCALRSFNRKKARHYLRSAYNKLWQKYVSKKLFKTLKPGAFSFKSLIKKNAHLAEPSGQKVYPRISMQSPFISGDLSMLVFLRALNPEFTIKTCLTMIECQMCSINGLVVTNPYQQLTPCTIFQLNLPSILFIIFSLLHNRLLLGSKKLNFSITKTVKYNSGGVLEVNFKTLEILVMPGLRKGYFLKDIGHIRFDEAEALRQRFFSRQKKFGLGRLL